VYGVYVAVQLYPWFNFYFPLFFFILTYDKEYETKENKKNEPRIKLNYNIQLFQVTLLDFKTSSLRDKTESYIVQYCSMGSCTSCVIGQ